MNKKLIFLLLLMFHIGVSITHAELPSFKEIQSHSVAQTLTLPATVPFKLEFANTSDEIAWGLMGRKSMPQGYGMLFSYQTPRILTFWMFNTYIDLSIAFLDEYHVIREIHDLKSYPEKMNDYPKLAGPRDLNRLSIKNPIIEFFIKEQIYSNFYGSYALEVVRGWFKENQIKIGDVVIWKKSKHMAFILRSIDISQFTKTPLPTLITFEKEGPVSLWLPSEAVPQEVALFDVRGIELKRATLYGGTAFYTETPIKFVAIIKSNRMDPNGQ